MTDQNNNASASNPLEKEHFYIARKALVDLDLSEEWFADLSSGRQTAPEQAEQQTESINRHLKQRFGDKATMLLPAQFHGMKLLHAAAHLIMSRLVAQRRPDFLNQVEFSAQKELTETGFSDYLEKFISLFPPSGVFTGEQTSKEYLVSASNRRAVLEESLFVWLQNQNPALDQFSFLLTDDSLRNESSYRTIVQTVLHSLEEMGPIGPGNINPAELLTMPIRHAPNSLLEQLRYIRMHWGDLLEGTPLLEMLDNSISLIQDEDTWLFFEKTGRENRAEHGGFFEKQAQAPAFGDLENEPENYSADSSWMPEVVMLAKSTFVWLDQLSKTYRRPINRLQDIPDMELDVLAERGFNALWLIGLWERSPASQKIKQLQGNPEAKSSAYALEGYTIADELGGHEGYLNLRHRALQRGIRLASDMVPNHTGLDSSLVKDKPEWFMSTHEPPYPSYTYSGPNLSNDPRFGIFIEDGYWNRSDAAVTFKRVDYQTGETRYIYHGNDGTAMPWNDTAQLNFLDAEVREGVIQQILHVAGMFPVIRFDAAMVLVKRHIQRLWYPLPEHTAGIPSRSSHAMSMEDFNRAIPEEFWREVVDRIHAEAPDTLLLAEAFWMLEGYFVRTLGMHRVYNSAFMHMLKKEDNAGYRYLIKNTLEFDAGILKRYVNFMNNPDEDTAVDQFGKDDKYFGVCAMMATMPGLPMFGHGQIEGFSEKYGMEYARAYLDEHPDDELVKRHQREIFPLLKKRSLFAGVENFFLYDVYTPEGSVNENVFCYSNRLGANRVLVAYNNVWEQATGYVKTSVGFKTASGIEQRSLCDGLGLSTDNTTSTFVIFRDHVSNIEFIRRVGELHEQGLHLVLGGYQYNVFLDFKEVRPSKLMPYDRLCDHLNGSGHNCIDTAALEMSLAPVHDRISSFCSRTNLDMLLDVTLGKTKQRSLLNKSLSGLLDFVAGEYGRLTGQPITVPQDAAENACDYLDRAHALASLLQSPDISSELKKSLGIEASQRNGFSHLALLWITLDSLERLLEQNGIAQQGVIDEFLIAKPLTRMFRENARLKNTPVEQLVDLFFCLLKIKMPVTSVQNPEKYLAENLSLFLADNSTPQAAAFLSVQKKHDKRWFSASRFNLLSSWLFAVTVLHAKYGRKQQRAFAKNELKTWLEALEAIRQDAFISGYEAGAFLKVVQDQGIIGNRRKTVTSE
ncbi:MAG: alpha-amylase family glycosyl hydrolase [Chlorobiales bacterium]|nr:alpha-amylase family glycosyl hydrolase [Chlorobiales bacterium]